MRASTLLTAAASATMASARLVGISAPATIAPNQNYTLTLLTENYIQSVADIAVAWGYWPSTSAYPRTLGSSVGSAYLGPNKSNQLKNVTIPVTAPAQLSGDKSVLSVSVFSLYGASSSTSVATWNVTVNVGDEVSGEVISREAVLGTA